MIRRGLHTGGAAVLAVLGLAAVGCQSTSGPIFPALDAPPVWPPAPDTPRIRYIGELRGESSLNLRATGWAALEELLGGPRPRTDFSRPSAVAVRGEQVCVADIGLGVVHFLNLGERRYAVSRGDPADPLQVPIDLALTPDGLVVADRKRAALEFFDLAGNWRATRRWAEIAAPSAVAWDAAARELWVADAATHACYALDLRSGAVRRQIGRRGSGPGEFNFPSGLACEAALGLAVVDAMNFRVQLFDALGQPTLAFGQKGNAAGDFARPRAVACDRWHHLYVVDNQFENVQIFNGQGRLLMALGGGGAGPGEFALPAGITIDEKNRIWIADSYNRRVQVFQYLPEAG